MNKKVLYGMLFTSIFILSSVALLAKPALGAKWSFGVPDAAKGIETESEVKIYEKSDWGHAIGYNPDDRVNQKHGVYREGETSNANDVGARQKSKILDWEKDDIWFLGDHLLYTKLDESIRQDASYDRTGDGISDLQTYWDAITFGHKTIKGLGGFEGGLWNTTLMAAAYSASKGLIEGGAGAIVGPTSEPLNWSMGLHYVAGTGMVPTVMIPGLESHRGCYTSTWDRADITAWYGKKYKGYILERDLWYWADNGDYESDPDEDEVETPFIEDPDDVVDSYWYFYGMTEALFAQIEIIIDDWTDWIELTGCSNNITTKVAMTSINNTFGYSIIANRSYNDGSAWDLLNSTLTANLLPTIQAQAGAGSALATQFLTILAAVFPNDMVATLWYMVWNALKYELLEFFRDKVPDKAEYLISLLRSGIPAHQDVGKWLDKMVEGFDIPDDVLYGADKYEQVGLDLWPATKIAEEQFYCDVSVNEMQVTVEIEWEDLVYRDPGVLASGERDDYEMIFSYSDTGGQSSVTYQNGDIFYKTESLAPVIPGYEISILLGAAAISAISLIYVVMKKRRM